MSSAFPGLELDGYAGKRLGRFEVMCKLGMGGMSEVFLAWQTAVGGFKRPVVLKRILESVRNNEEFLRMFVKEAKITSGLSHSGIAHLYELVHDQADLFMVMEFVAGATLVEVARACHVAHEAIPIGFSLSVLRDTALALHYAHTFVDPVGRPRSVIHRDVAEKNIMVALDGNMKLLDFGIARQIHGPALTQVGTVKGTAGYMSPEQVRGEPLDGRTDIFSLGVVLHECLTGQRLFRRNTLSEEVQALLESPIPAPSQKNREVPVGVDAVVMKALSREKSYRYATAKELAEAIETAAGADLWPVFRRGEFIQRHFERRQKDIMSLLGDPSATDIGELLSEDPKRVARDGSRTVNQKRPMLADDKTGQARTVNARSMPNEVPAENPELDEKTRDVVRPSVPVLATDAAKPADPPRITDSGRKLIRRNAELAEAVEAEAEDDEEPRTVMGPPPKPSPPNAPNGSTDEEPRTVLSLPGTIDAAKALRRTQPAMSSQAEKRTDGRVPLDEGQGPTYSLEEPRTMIESNPSIALRGPGPADDARPTDEAPEQPALAPQRLRARNLAAEKQALLMWIAIGSGLLLGVALAAFLIFG